MKVGNMQKTFFIIKPDAVKRHLIGQVLDRIERRGFVIERMEMLMLDEERLKEHYAQLADKPFFPSISEFMMSGPAVIGIMSGPGVIKSWRDMMGATNPGDAAPGTIRGDFATAPDGDMIPNIVHGSDSEVAQDGLLIDVRTPEEYAEGHVKDALLIPHTQFFTADIPAKKDASIYLYCKMGSRAEFAAGVLKERGYTKVTTLGGLGDMEALGFKFEK